MQIRRQTRLRREYLYRKALEDKEKSVHERKRKLKAALDGVWATQLLRHTGNGNETVASY